MPRPTVLQFNKELIAGECGSLALAYVAAYIARALTPRPAIISGAIVAGTLCGGTLLWLIARIHHRRQDRQLSVRGLAEDISYFTPAALVCGFFVYDPAIYFASHHLLVGRQGVARSVLFAQLLAFTLFLGCMNAYRALLVKTRGKPL